MIVEFQHPKGGHKILDTFDDIREIQQQKSQGWILTGKSHRHLQRAIQKMARISKAQLGELTKLAKRSWAGIYDGHIFNLNPQKQ